MKAGRGEEGNNRGIRAAPPYLFQFFSLVAAEEHFLIISSIIAAVIIILLMLGKAVKPNH